MPLDLQVNDGAFTPYIKYNAKAGRFYVKLDGVDGDIEIQNPTLAFDFANIKTGWIAFYEGSAPQKVFDLPNSRAEKPEGDRFKRGFEVMVYGSDEVGAGHTRVGLRELSSTAGAAIGPILIMYATYEGRTADQKDDVPVYKCVSVKAIPAAKGQNYEPVFELTKWIHRSEVPGFDKAQQDAGPPPVQDGEPLPPEPPVVGDEAPF